MSPSVADVRLRYLRAHRMHPTAPSIQYLRLASRAFWKCCWTSGLECFEHGNDGASVLNWIRVFRRCTCVIGRGGGTMTQTDARSALHSASVRPATTGRFALGLGLTNECNLACSFCYRD